MSGSNVHTTSTPASSSSLRPRPRRLISGLSDGEDKESEFVSNTGPSPFASRSASPIPAAHPQRTTGVGRDSSERFAGGSWGRRAQLAAQRKGPAENPTSPSSLAGLWGTSWTTLQGLASEFLGNDGMSEGEGVKGRQKKPFGRLYNESGFTSNRSMSSQWGPNAPTSQPISSDIGSGTRVEREAALRAKKREALLWGQESSYADALGKFKRRLSDDHESLSAPPSENDNRSALVYIHHVSKDDTMAGITIKYNIPANVLRKANRMWPNDSIQTRTTLLLPVDQCAVKGKPVSDSSALDLLSSELDSLSAGQAEEVPPATQQPPQINGDSSRHRSTSISTTTNPTSSRRASSSTGREGESGPPWTHDSWVQLPAFERPTEIARLLRRTLGHFPPARRKSLSYSERNTPSTSLDITRIAQPAQSSKAESGSGRETLTSSSKTRQPNANAHTITNSGINSTSTSPQRPRRGRKLSDASTGYFPSYLSGPGGVGTMSKNVHHPGPAQDGLNKFFAKHLPDVAPPPNQRNLYQPETPLYTDEGLTPTGSRMASPSRNGAGLENLGGAIEGWVRRLASKAQTSMANTDRSKSKAARASVGTPGTGADGVGDLIEMTDDFEIGSDGDEREEPERGRQSAAGVGSSSTDYLGGAAAKGRAVGGTGTGRKSGKAD